ncbi:hypothetical protein [Streptomyces hainanensis]|uniref:Integral membrane protein n=1 Tax=Streptomyces hainanensis TaxID=402648 RepID=A0A4R4TTF0_9ACTN|nr:hypothetical protein [Streptomyces hainanensis]TDC79274.1 hypothetical protein E1283_03070 [Streptomyces hainanensis]
MILLVPVVLLTAVVLVVFCLVRCLRVALPGQRRHWSGWRRVVVAGAWGCGAVATASYSLGVMVLMLTVATARDGGADSAPFPPDHPCRSQFDGAIDYQVRFTTLRTVCEMEDGTRRAADDVPQAVRGTAAASVAGAAVLAGIALTGRPPQATDRS